MTTHARFAAHWGCILLVLLSSVKVHPNDAEDLLRKPDRWYSGPRGKEAVANILSWQTAYGDWPKNVDTVGRPSNETEPLRGTFDNGATTGELRVLARAYGVTEDPEILHAFLLGFDHILRGQYRNGGWPQSFPLRGGYPDHITFNDNTMIRLMDFLRDSARDQDFSFLDRARKASADAAWRRGVDVILRAQIMVNGQRTVWCAQHHPETLEPMGARRYELPSLSGGESASILRFLMSIEAPSEQEIRAVEAGVSWFREAEIQGKRYVKENGDRVLKDDPEANGLWARFYEIETNRPIFCDRDGILRYHIHEIGSERRNGYSWYGNWGRSVAEAYESWTKR